MKFRVADPKRMWWGVQSTGNYYLSGGYLLENCCRLPSSIDMDALRLMNSRYRNTFTWVPVRTLQSEACFRQYRYCPLQLKVIGLGLIWIDDARFETVGRFMGEDGYQEMCVPVDKPPDNFEPGRTWVLFGHDRAMLTSVADTVMHVPGVFAMWKPERIEYCVDDNFHLDMDELTEMRERGVTVVKLKL